MNITWLWELFGIIKCFIPAFGDERIQKSPFGSNEFGCLYTVLYAIWVSTNVVPHSYSEQYCCLKQLKPMLRQPHKGYTRDGSKLFFSMSFAVAGGLVHSYLGTYFGCNCNAPTL